MAIRRVYAGGMESPSKTSTLFLSVSDPGVRAEVAGALTRRFGPDYAVLAPESADAADALGSAAAAGVTVALVISDDHAPELFDLA